MIVEKAGKSLEIVTGPNSSGDGRLMKDGRLPCRCHGIKLHCSCKIGEWECKVCGRVYVNTPPYSVKGERFLDWYEIKDPHRSKVVKS